MAKKVKQKHGGAINRFEPGESGNPNGRPPKLLSSVLKELKDAGYQRVTIVNVIEAYELLFGLDEEKIKQKINDKKQPMLIRIVAKAMLSPKGVEMLEKMMDRAYGKAVQPTDQTINITQLPKQDVKIIDDIFKGKEKI